MKKTLAAAMEFVLSFLLLLLNLINYHSPVNSFVFLAAGTALFVSLFWVCATKSKNFLVACAMMFCHTWQISWYNIFGKSTDALQLPWFYVVGVLIVAYAIFNYRKLYTASVSTAFISNLILVVVFAFIPLVLAPSVSEALKEYIMIMFFVVIVAVTFFCSNTAENKALEHVLNSYVWCSFISCILIIFQAVMFFAFGVYFFYHSQGVFFGNATQTFGLLMQDLSSATIMLGSAVFICISKIEKKKNIVINSLIILVIIIGMTFTTRRTSTVSLVVILALYALTHYKSTVKKIVAIFFFAVVAGVMLYYFQYSRPMEDLSMIFYDNARFENYIRVIEVVFTHPFGVGFDSSYANTFMANGIAPHNTFLRWTLMGGPLFSVSLMAVPIYTLFVAYKKKLTVIFWIILYSVLASNFIPDILTARFFVIPCLCALLFKGEDKNDPIKIRSR